MPIRVPSPFPPLARLIAGPLLAAALLSGCATPGPGGGPTACAASPDALQVCTQQGAVRGLAENGMLAFKGIPYAAPPVGARRWQPPAPPLSWEGVRDASRFGAICPQLAGDQLLGDEDCLTLNVWTPAPRPAQPLPVMVFLTGGGNHSYSGQGGNIFGGVNYNGGALTREGVVFVSFNYRLGALGFLAHPALDAHSPQHVSGNYGSEDQVAMLRWLHDNIAAFGGDPQRVMLFGTSAGGGNICALMTAPSARGLFQRAAMQSSVPTGCEIPALADTEAGTGQQVVQKLGCQSGDTYACLAGKSTAEIVRAVPGTFGVLPRIYGPNVDGVVFPQQPRVAIERGEHAHMPVIIGNDTQETQLFVGGLGAVTDAASYEAALARTFGAPAAPRIVAEYPIAQYPSARSALVRATTDALFTCQTLRVARLLSTKQQEPVYRYLFAHSLNNDPEQRALGPVHTIEHAFLFPWEGSYKPDAQDLAVQHRMVGDWTTFAKQGALPSNGAPAWPLAEPGDRYLRIDAQPLVEGGDGGAHCRFWDTVALPWPHL